MSGAGRQKGDYRTDHFRVEDRTTRNRSYSLSLDGRGWLKIEREAHLTPPTLMPQIRVTIGEGSKDERTLRVLAEDDYLWLMKLAARNFDDDAVSEEG